MESKQCKERFPSKHVPDEDLRSSGCAGQLQQEHELAAQRLDRMKAEAALQTWRNMNR